MGEIRRIRQARSPIFVKMRRKKRNKAPQAIRYRVIVRGEIVLMQERLIGGENKVDRFVAGHRELAAACAEFGISQRPPEWKANKEPELLN